MHFSNLFLFPRKKKQERLVAHPALNWKEFVFGFNSSGAWHWFTRGERNTIQKLCLTFVKGKIKAFFEHFCSFLLAKVGLNKMASHSTLHKIWESNTAITKLQTTFHYEKTVPQNHHSLYAEAKNNLETQNTRNYQWHKNKYQENGGTNRFNGVLFERRGLDLVLLVLQTYHCT